VNALTLPAQRLSSRGPGNHTPDPAGGRLLRLTWGGTRRFIGRLLTGCALARYPAYSAARSKVTTVTMMCCSPASEGGIATLQKQARNRALDLAPTIQELHAGGCSAGHCSGPGRADKTPPRDCRDTFEEALKKLGMTKSKTIERDDGGSIDITTAIDTPG
jgi:hypothetical protein